MNGAPAGHIKHHLREMSTGERDAPGARARAWRGIRPLPAASPEALATLGRG
jgi:hypothetical protein